MFWHSKVVQIPVCAHSWTAFLGKGIQGGRLGGLCFTSVLVNSREPALWKKSVGKPLSVHNDISLLQCSLSIEMPPTDISNKLLSTGQPRLWILNQASYIYITTSVQFFVWKGINIFDLTILVPLHLWETSPVYGSKGPSLKRLQLAMEARYDLFKFSFKAIQYILKNSKRSILKE